MVIVGLELAFYRTNISSSQREEARLESFDDYFVTPFHA